MIIDINVTNYLKINFFCILNKVFISLKGEKKITMQGNLIKNIFIFFIFMIILSCNEKVKKDNIIAHHENKIDFILKMPKSPKGIVVLFPSYGSGIIKTDEETKIDDKCLNEGYASLFIDYKYEFYLKEYDFVILNDLINDVIKKNNIPSKNLFIGGFSVGGNIALSYCIWFKKLNRIKNKPLGVFVGDSPVDLYGLYNSQVKAIKDNSSTDLAKDEGEFIINYLKVNLGDPNLSMSNYYKFSPFVDMNIEESNLKYLTNYNIHFYSEPDLEWFKEIFGYDSYQNINSFKIERMKKELDKISTKKTYHTKTKNKGYRNNIKNPHSWSIINEDDFFNWMLECQND